MEAADAVDTADGCCSVVVWFTAVTGTVPLFPGGIAAAPAPTAAGLVADACAAIAAAAAAPAAAAPGRTRGTSAPAIPSPSGPTNQGSASMTGSVARRTGSAISSLSSR